MRCFVNLLAHGDRRVMKKLVIVLVMVVSLFGGEINWSEDFETAVVEAKKAHKEIYTFISSTTCPWCKKFEKNVLTNDRVIQALQKEYIVVHLIKEMDDMPKGYSARVIPRHYFADATGKPYYTFAGYYDADDFISTLKEIDEEKAELKAE